MNNFNWDKFKNEKIAVWCDSEERAKEFVEECHRKGLGWGSCSFIKEWDIHKSQSCYCYNTDSLRYSFKKFYEQEGCKIIKWESEESQTEFTFQEVIARIKEGETYEAINIGYATQTITMEKGKDIIIDILSNQHYIVPTYSLFKLQEPKKRVRIYKIEHQKNGKQYDFISSQLLDCDEFVICDTECGKSYGIIVDAETRELTESEIKQYKECWRA